MVASYMKAFSKGCGKTRGNPQIGLGQEHKHMARYGPNCYIAHCFDDRRFRDKS